MIVAQLVKQWLSRRARYGFTPSIGSIARSLRVLRYRREHRRLCALDVYRNYVAMPANDDLFHYLSHRFYLSRHLAPRARVACVLRHYGFEDETFNTSYKYAVYRAGGLTLWQRCANGCRFAITLSMASRMDAEGDLTIMFEADGACLHRLSFSWIEGRFAGVEAPLVPFVARNQGSRPGSHGAIAAFEQAFPHNSPSLFCTAAMQGVALAVGMTQIAAIKHSAHPFGHDAPPQRAARMAAAYDHVWEQLGGVELPGPSWLIELPYRLKPLSDIPARHRRRAATRRAHWNEIGEAARAMLASKLKRVPRLAPPPTAPAPRQAASV
ncbi:DUF535 family protein [Massilia sp. R2A-15]|uniref:DUF535 family protein n=1 Tax=Massilia sp. R2A-15 TaxID=3064278 RepID=UPI0027335E63|nr:DUF535 family protein [Massilia sp. R2A-15]WLI87466.1 DUF535 family protein [Massilia sp. R2A-15]